MKSRFLFSLVIAFYSHLVYSNDSTILKDTEKVIGSAVAPEPKQSDSLNGLDRSSKGSDTAAVPYGKLIINVYPLTSSLLINKVNVGKGNVVVDNVRPGLYEIIVCNETVTKKRYVTVYPYVASKVNVVADDYHVKVLPSYKFLLDEHYISGPSIEVGVQKGFHYGSFEYFWSTNGSEKDGQRSYDNVDWYYYDTLHIFEQYKTERSFSGWGFKYLYNNLYVNSLVSLGIGCKVGYLKITELYKAWDTYTDTLGVKRIYRDWPNVYSSTISQNYFSPVIRLSIGRNKYYLCIDYEYFLGDIKNQMLTTSISYQIY